MGPFIRSGWRCVCALVGGGLVLSGLAAGPPVRSALAPASGLLRYEAPQGMTYAALILPAPPLPKIACVPHDHVLIVDTSASQNGIYRTRALALANAFCQNLPAGDRVQLIASDVAAVSLTDTFVDIPSPALRAAFVKLEDRVPLGSSNLEFALRMSLPLQLKNVSGDRAREILYVGDGFSTAKLIESPMLLKLLHDLRTSEIPVNSFAVGPRTDLILLGTLAQHTGGVVVVDEQQPVAARQGTVGDLATVAKDLARAAVAPVFYPDSLVTTPDDLQLYPIMLPPVRFDRETVLLGKDVIADQIQIKLTGSLRRHPADFSWLIKGEKATASLSFLAPAWTLAESSQGLAMPFAGRQLLNRAQQDFETQLDSLAQAGVRSLGKKDKRQVEEIAQVLQDLDPSNLDAPQLLRASHRLQVKPVKGSSRLAQAAGQPQATAEQQPGPAGQGPGKPDQLTDTEDKSNPKSGSLLDDLEAKRKVREEQITIDVNVAIQAAQTGARESFPDAYDILKRQLDTVVAATDISADARQALRKRVETAIQQMQNESESFEQKRAALDRQLSQQEAMKKLMDQTQRDEEKMEQLIDRVRALLIRGYKGNPQAFEDAEAVSRVAVELDPYLGVPNLDVFNSEAAGHLDKSRRLRSLRQDKLLALLYQVELSHVPFPDEPPVVWPSPERWQWISENRKKWKSVDLKSYSKKEEKIVRELDKPTTFDFTDESLDGVKDTIMERHGFDIVIDKAKLEEESVATDATDITLKVSEISLKNALKLLLDAKNLTYVIENEVMKITTKTDGIAKRPLRVSNVGDLVMPINPLFGRGGSRTGGQSGGGGGQFNGGQQGGGGMGGGGGGQFGGGANGIGGGGGFF
ncbi:MAG: domain containing CoxE-like protein [Planctomycetaceae bacterium]|nr:domain containing CoxE-like protein [Planctomycetaceae bacterium]